MAAETLDVQNNIGGLPPELHDGGGGAYEPPHGETTFDDSSPDPYKRIITFEDPFEAITSNRTSIEKAIGGALLDGTFKWQELPQDTSAPQPALATPEIPGLRQHVEGRNTDMLVEIDDPELASMLEAQDPSVSQLRENAPWN